MPLPLPYIPFPAPFLMPARIQVAFAALLTLAPLGHSLTPVQDSVRPHVLIRASDDEGFGLVGEVWTENRVAPIPIPLTSRSATVQRAVPNSRGIQLRLQASAGDFEINSVRVHAVRHPSDSQVLIDGEDIILVGPPDFSLGPDSNQDRPFVSPYFLRQDGIGWSARKALYLPTENLPKDYRRITIETYTHFVGFDRSVRPGSSRSVCTEEDRRGFHGWMAAGIDQQFYAKTETLDLDQCERIELIAAQHQVGIPDQSNDEHKSAEVLSTIHLSDDQALLLSTDEFLEICLPAPPAGHRDSTFTLLLSLEAKPLANSVPKSEEPAVELTADEWEERIRREDEEESIGSPLDFWRNARQHYDLAPESFLHVEGPDLQLDIRPTMGPGLAAGDVDGDGDPDLYLVQGSGREGTRAPGNRLLLNESARDTVRYTALRFTEVRNSGAEHRGAGMGALFFDAEGDGDLDLYVANYGADVMYTNDGTGKFEDVTEAAGIEGDRWSAGIAAADADLDGDLDLYVTSYLVYDESLMPTDEGFDRYQREDPTAMLPFAFPADRNVYWRNDSWLADESGGRAGPVKFTDRTAELGLLDEQGRGMQPVFWDFDRDGDQDLYVANDVSFNTFFRNEAGKSFTNVSFTTGMDDPRGGMGVSIGDADSDGDEDLFLTNWQLEPNALYMNNLITTRSRKSYIATFRDTIVKSRLGRYGVGYTSWGAELFDADLDGDLDLFVANGYTSPDYESTGICVGQPNHFFLNDGEGRFEAAFGSAALSERHASRAVLACDFDRDGDPDLAITANNGPFTLLENNSDELGDAHWLGVQLSGVAPNTFAIGAEVTVTIDDRVLRRSLRAGGSYLAGNAPELLFGLGDHAGAVELSVRWPSGRESEHSVPAIDRFVIVEEPK